MVDIKKEAISLGKDLAFALVILLIILGSLYVYSGRWPPMVVVESSSMSHSQASQLGVIDTGDIVVVKQTTYSDVVTYVDGRASGHSTYGQYGDVIIYRPMGSDQRTPIIHRPVVYLEYNSSSRTFDVPSLRHLEFGRDWWTPQGEGQWWGLNTTLSIIDYGYNNVNVTIELDRLLNYEHSGFITMGDNNITPTEGRYDQLFGSICPAPVKGEWLEGKARGELPWFGILKLTLMGKTDDVPTNSVIYLVLSMAFIISLPFVVEAVRERIFPKKEDEAVDDEEEPPEQEEETLFPPVT